jgi:hypothetical protein
VAARAAPLPTSRTVVSVPLTSISCLPAGALLRAHTVALGQ